MSKNIFILLIVWILHVDCNYDDRAKIKTSDGNLYLEPARGKNIYLRTNGPQSSVYIGDTNLINVTSGRRDLLQPQRYEVDTLSYATDDVLRRLQALENLNLVSHDDFITNVSNLSLRISRISNRLSRLQRQIDSWAGDQCQLHTCQYGGTCLNLVGDFHCLCPLNWEGRNCEIDVNECRNLAGTDLGCQNGADCINKPGSYECQCRSGWYGTHCTRRKLDCSAGNYEMCGHGTCVPVTSGDGIKCICDQGWTTNNSVVCLTDVNECDTSLGSRCSSNPKVDCINLPGSFRCGECPSGFQGDGYVCYDIDECATSNGGCSSMVSCHNTIGSRICGTCPSGYVGDGITCSWRGSCSFDNGGCHPSAKCVENLGVSGGVQCECPQGMDGDGVGIHGCYVSTNNSTKSCENNPCGSNGRCHTLRDGYTCICLRGYSGAHCDIKTQKCVINPCKNGGICRRDSTMALGFRCECTAQYTGTLCQERSRCGSILRAEEGSLVYPISNTSYESNSKCAWIIRTVPEKVVNVTFGRFNLERSPDCNFVFLQIHDGRSTADPLLGRFCGNDPPMGGHIVSSQHNLYLWFLSNTADNHSGFSLHWNSVTPVCGGEVNATIHGAISSPGSPGKYPPNRDCFWHLRTMLGKRIQLYFFQLDIEAHNNCSFDYLAIYDGYQTTDHLLEKYCSASQPAPLLSSGPEILIHFHSDAHSSGKGFQISYAPVEGVPGCGGIFSGDKGEISSPSYDGSYLSNLMCEYKIRTGQGTQIQLNFKLFKLERSRNCKRDYLKIYDGSSSEFPIIGTFCGELDRVIILNSTSNNIFMVFRSDRSRGGEGFKITYKVICNYFVRGDSGVIKSPGYPFTYPDNRVCEYVIETTPGKAIQLFFQDFDIEGDTGCNFDNVEIRDGMNDNSTLLGKFCGNNVPPAQTSSHNIMYLRFNSDMSQSGGGFYANFTTIDIECGGIYKDLTGTITHPSGSDKYKRTQTCIWIILAPAGKYIKLTWSRFEIENTKFCTADYLELSMMDNDDNTSRKYCGHTLPPTMMIPTNRLKMKFESDQSIQAGGFSVTYSLIDVKGYCGGHLIQNHGIIYSPGWPNRYDRNLDCVWTIGVPTGQQIKLNISNVDLEYPNYRTKKCDDFLKVTNGPSSSSPLIGEYCGQFNWKSITSTANSLYLHFHSDFLLGGKGFKIEWDSTVTGCGGTFTGYKGSISSPNYPHHYEENSECFYRIVTNEGSRISIEFLEFDLEDNDLCDDHVEIFDGRDPESRSLGKYCNKPPKQLIKTTSNYAFIKFKSDFLIGGKGFLISYSALCNNTLTAYYGVIESLNYPNSYPVNLNCTWIISVPKGSKINVTFSNFDVRSNRLWYWDRQNSDIFSQRRSRTSPCNVDYLLIGEPGIKDNTSRHCGLNTLTQISTVGNLLNVSFFVKDIDVPQEHSGFRLEWLSYGCRGHIKKTSGYFNKTLSSSDAMECEWLIEVPLGESIKLTFATVYMLETNNCTTDVIEIYNGPTKDSPLLTRLCHISNDATSVTSTSNYLLVKLVKNSSLKDVHLAAAFITTELTCGGSLHVKSGFISSKNYPKNYDNNLDCTWTITVPSGHRVKLEFDDIDLNNEDDDCNDALKLYDTTDILTSNYTHIICDKLSTKHYISKSNVLMVQFVSNEDGTAKGFKARFAMTCGGAIALTDKSKNGIITNENFNSQSNSSCVWVILAPNLEEKVSLILTHLSLPITNDRSSNQTCPNSYLRILDGDDENAPLINEYCGRKIPATIVSRGSALTVLLGTHDDKMTGVFSAYYSAIEVACGGTLTSESGVIASPNYPASYPVNAVCEWILQTSPGNRVSINFDMLDIGYSEDCNEDYLEVRENDGAGPILGIYCGSVLPINATSASKLFIKFHSDNKNPGRGFLIQYSFVHGNNIIDINNGEISSPMYPRPYDSSGEFWWRVVSGNQAIILEVDKLQINTHSELCDDDNLSIYDGNDDEAPIIKKLCGALHGAVEEMRTTSNAAYIKLTLNNENTGALFHIRWSQGERDIDQTIDEVNCGSNVTVTVRAGMVVETFTSPNYPRHYANKHNCEWIFKATPGRHLSLNFIDFDIEERDPCTNGDYVSIYTSNVPVKWKVVEENICLNSDAKKGFSAGTFMKIIFRSDSSHTKKGFSATVKSVCGANLTDSSGFIESAISELVSVPYRCDWKVSVRPGRRIKLEFVRFNIMNKYDDCQSYIVFHNGESLESPRLSDGKYCGYAHENRSAMITSGNNLFISYIRSSYKTTQHFKLHYEEIQVKCGGTSKLNIDHAWEIISTPNYPNVPDPYMECNWLFTAPIGEILRVDFVERFDLHEEQDCISEFVEIHDGSSDLSPTKGHFCGQNPGTVKSSGNSIFIKYVTERAEPNNGFQANISIDICGGIIRASEGEITSPGYPNVIHLPPGTVCEWQIIGLEFHTISVTPQEMNLPESESYCTTKVTIEEFDPISNTNDLLKSYCTHDEDGGDFDRSVIQTSDNSVKVRLHIGTPSEYNSGVIHTGFRLTFKSSQSSCRETLTTSEGYITTPNYPKDASIKSCHWSIKVPDQRQRVTLEILDSTKNGVHVCEGDLERTIEYRNEFDISSHNTTYESSGNSMEVIVYHSGPGPFRFKARFTSYDRAICGGLLSGITGQIKSPDDIQAYYCKWTYNGDTSTDLKYDINLYQSLLITGIVNSSVFISKRFCHPFGRWFFLIDYSRETYTICNKEEEVSYIIPSKSNVNFIAFKRANQSLNFDLQWQLQPCGGVIKVAENAVNILNIPQSYNYSIDCVWALSRDTFQFSISIKLEGKFISNCDEEFIKIGRMSGIERHYLFDYCKDKTQNLPDIVTFQNVFIEYHGKTQSSRDIKIFVKTVTGQCGGSISNPGVFSSPNFPKDYESNIECEWEIKSVNLGFRISLQFINRFAIEKSPNCTKDVIIIYDWKDDNYIEIARLCGREIPPVFNSTYDKLKIVMRTDNETNLDGFQARWKQICGGTYNATDTEQYIYSPGYPYYSPPKTCTYKIISTERNFELEFIDFELAGYPGSCENDNLTISATSRHMYYFKIFCGNEYPKINTMFKEVEIVFNAESSIGKRGFKLAYSLFSCSGHITGPTTIVSGPHENYHNNLNCTCLIEAPKNKVVVLKVIYFQLEKSYECMNDYLAVYEGSSIDTDKRLALLCGDIISSTAIRSKGNTMTVQFISDAYLQSKGFKFDVAFTYSESVGCGGAINITTSSYTLTSPHINSQNSYENFLDCHWNILAPLDHVIKVSFTTFHIAPCSISNQTAAGDSQCDCDFVEIKDGINPDSLVIGTYCGHTLPSEVVSSDNILSIRLSTDGEITSSGFTAKLIVEESVCGPSMFNISRGIVQRIKSPLYDTESIPRGIHCVYHFITPSPYQLVHIHFNDFDLLSGTTNAICDKDRIFITSITHPLGVSLGKDYIQGHNGQSTLSSSIFMYYSMISNATTPEQYMICGSKKSIDIYVTGSFDMNVITSPQEVSRRFRGIDVEVSMVGFCGRNFTELYARVSNNYEFDSNRTIDDCYTLVSVPENYTISLYFNTHSYVVSSSGAYLVIYDGNTTSSKKILSLGKGDVEYNMNPIFSTGKYILLHNHISGMEDMVTYDFTYMATDKGRGCGGYFYGTEGTVTSPLYPAVYRFAKTCEWELETPHGTRLSLHFETFDLGSDCDHNYVQLVDRAGTVLSSYCMETPAYYSSVDNYVKIVFVTTRRNGGTGWIVRFISIL